MRKLSKEKRKRIRQLWESDPDIMGELRVRIRKLVNESLIAKDGSIYTELMELADIIDGQSR